MPTFPVDEVPHLVGKPIYLLLHSTICQILPRSLIHIYKSDIKRDAAALRGFIHITPIEGLSYKMSLNIDYNNKTNHDYTNPTYGTGSIKMCIRDRTI